MSGEPAMTNVNQMRVALRALAARRTLFNILLPDFSTGFVPRLFF